jgi:endogenous inhibitor of DNA gyrase (YacG/DUF329 family)
LRVDLVQLAPFLPAWSVPCPQCGRAACLKSVEPIEPHAVLRMERHTFECGECGLPRSYTLDLSVRRPDLVD